MLVRCWCPQEKIKGDEKRVKVKAKNRREMEDAAEQQRKAAEDFDLASAEFQNAAIAVRSNCIASSQHVFLLE